MMCKCLRRPTSAPTALRQVLPGRQGGSPRPPGQRAVKGTGLRKGGASEWP
jgi:hypothetical protein